MNKKPFFILCLLLVFVCQLSPVSRRSVAAENKQQAAGSKQSKQQAALDLKQELSRLDPEEDTAAYLDILMRLTSAYQYIGNHRQALANLYEVLPLIENHPDHRRNALFFNTTADVCLSLGYRKQAAHYLEQGIKQAELAKDPRTEASILNHIANLFAVRGDYDNAITAYQKCLERIRTPRLFINLGKSGLSC